MQMRLVVNLVLLCCFADRTLADVDLASGMMRGTFKIEGPPGCVGTAFVVGRPRRSDSKKASRVLVTAAHVLEHIQGDKAVLHCRKISGEKYERVPLAIPIRRDNKPLWVKHPNADVAVMYLPLPKEMNIDSYLIGTGVFISDKEIQECEIHPDDTLFALGFPFGEEANPQGFPILRSGAIASFPITRSAGGDTFLFDFEVYQGNSGGPVFLIDENPRYGGDLKLGRVFRGLMGIVSERRIVTEKVTSLSETRIQEHPLSIAVVIHASVIKEAIYMLPDIEEDGKEAKQQDDAQNKKDNKRVEK